MKSLVLLQSLHNDQINSLRKNQRIKIAMRKKLSYKILMILLDLTYLKSKRLMKVKFKHKDKMKKKGVARLMNFKIRS